MRLKTTLALAASLALAAGAHGVHLGQTDLSVAHVRSRCSGYPVGHAGTSRPIPMC